MGEMADYYIEQGMLNDSLSNGDDEEFDLANNIELEDEVEDEEDYDMAKTKTKTKAISKKKIAVKSTGPPKGRPFKAQGVGHQVLDKIMDERRGKKGALGYRGSTRKAESNASNASSRSRPTAQSISTVRAGSPSKEPRPLDKMVKRPLGVKVAPAKMTVMDVNPDTDSGEAMAILPSEVFTTVVADTFKATVSRLAYVKAALKILGDEEKVLVDSIKDTCDGLDKTKFIDNDMPPVTYSFSKNTQINVGKLLEKGVDPEVIAFARGDGSSPMLTVDWKATVEISGISVDTILEILTADVSREDETNGDIDR